MEILEYFYESSPKNDFFYPRKLRLPEGDSFVLCGARATGKTSLILEYLRPLEEERYLYIDAQDPVFALEDIDVDLLESFLNEEGIEILVLDHWHEHFLERLPSVGQLILVTRTPPSSSALPLYELFPLDYEEFLGFDRGHSPTLAFNRFLKTGTLPSVNRSLVPSVSLELRRLFYEKFNDQESRLLLILARFHGRRVTTHQIYMAARESFRISKDWVYATVKEFEKEKLVYFVEPISRESGKKLLLYDFVLTRYLNKRQPFAVTFETMMALTLMKHGFPFRSAGHLGYRLEDRNELVMPAPFEEEEQLWKRVHARYGAFRKTGAAKISVVTISNRFAFRIGEIEFEALPFYEWSILNE